MMPITMKGIITFNSPQERPINPPAVHIVISLDTLNCKPMYSEIANRNADTAAPANTIRNGECPPYVAALIRKTTIAPKTAPAKQAIIVPKYLIAGNKAALTASIAFAPAVKPRSPGSANGFLVIPCITAPETASAAPTNTAPISRGNRISLIMDVWEFDTESVSTNQISRTVISPGPKTIASIKLLHKIHKPVAAFIKNAYLDCFSLYIHHSPVLY